MATRATSLKHFLDTAMAKNPSAIFVDSTILVNGYHIYSAACNYNNSVSNLCCSWPGCLASLLLRSPIFRLFPGPVPENMPEDTSGDCPSLRDRWSGMTWVLGGPPQLRLVSEWLWENGVCRLDWKRGKVSPPYSQGGSSGQRGRHGPGTSGDSDLNSHGW